MSAEHARRPPRRARGLVDRVSELLGFRTKRAKPGPALARRRYDDDVWVGSSPTVRDVEGLARRAGFRAILSLNVEGEPGEVLSPNVEASWAHTFEMQHERVSIDLGALPSGWVDRFLETLRSIAKPVYVHSRSGRRAGALMTLHLAHERELSAKEALAEAKRLGLDGALDELVRYGVATEFDAGPERPAADRVARVEDPDASG